MSHPSGTPALLNRFLSGLGRGLIGTWLLATALAAAAPSAAVLESQPLPAWEPGPRGSLAFETNPLLVSTSFAHPEKLETELNQNGAYSPVNQAWDRTRQGKWYIEEQRYAVDAIAAGIALHRQDVIDRGEKIFDWGFRQEGTDGGFACPDAFHSASFFIEAAARSALLLEASDLAAQNQAWVDHARPKLHAAARWMTNPVNETPGDARDRPMTHRFYLDADAIGETGVLVGDAELVAHSRRYIQAGLARQDPSGFNPEKHGFDTSYHSVGILFAITYYTIVADDPTRREMTPMIERGLAWLKGRTRPDGTVDQTGNTRTGFGQEEGRNGTLKTMSYGSAIRASYYWAMVNNDESWKRFAVRLYEGGIIEKKQAGR